MPIVLGSKAPFKIIASSSQILNDLTGKEAWTHFPDERAAFLAWLEEAGIDSVKESQRMSARSLGLTQIQALIFVIVPQAIRNVVPALLNGLVSLQKDVALVFVLGIREAVREAQIYTARTFNYTSYVVAAVLFLIISIPFARYTDWYTERDRRRRQAMSQ